MQKKILDLAASVVLFFSGCASQSDTLLLTDSPLEAGNHEASALQKRPPAEPNSTFRFEEPKGNLTLGDVVTLTLLHNPSLKSYSIEIRAAEARSLQAGLWPNPSLDIGVEDIGGSGDMRSFDAAETTIQLSQLIELGDKAQKRRNVASIEKELAGWDYETKRLEILTEAGKAYFELLALQDKTELLAELLNVSSQTLKSVTERVDAGKDSPIEKTKASVALSNVKIEYEQALQELEQARKFAASFWGNEKPQFLHAEGNLETITEIPDVNELYPHLMQNPQMARWDKEISRDKAAIELAKSKSIPDISIGAGVKRFNETDDNALIFGVAIPFPIFSRNQGERMEALVNLSRTYEEQKAARIELVNQFNRIFTELTISLNKIKELRLSSLPGSEEVFEASKTAYDEGKVDYLYVLDAQRTFFLLKTEYIKTLVQYHKSKTDIEGLMGQNMNEIKNTNK